MAHAKYGIICFMNRNGDNLEIGTELGVGELAARMRAEGAANTVWDIQLGSLSDEQLRQLSATMAGLYRPPSLPELNRPRRGQSELSHDEQPIDAGWDTF